MEHDRPLELMVRMLEAYATLAPEDRDALLSLPFTLRDVDPSTYLVREGEAPTISAVLLSGFAYRQKLCGDGGRQIVSLHIPGDALDLQHLFLDIADHNVQTLTHAKVAIIPRAALQRIVRERASVAHAIFTSILVEASTFREWVLNVGRRDARTRLAHLLCEFAMRLDKRGLAEEMGYELPMTQEQLGDALGLTPVHINRMMKSLETEGFLLRNKRHVSFPQWANMRGLADFNGRYLHLEQQQRPS